MKSILIIFSLSILISCNEQKTPTLTKMEMENDSLQKEVDWSNKFVNFQALNGARWAKRYETLEPVEFDKVLDSLYRDWFKNNIPYWRKDTSYFIY